jgi:hypothetical protein
LHHSHGNIATLPRIQDTPRPGHRACVRNQLDSLGLTATKMDCTAPRHTSGLCKPIAFCKPIQQFATQFREPWFGRKAKTPGRWGIQGPDAASRETRRPRSPQPEHSGKTDSHELANLAWPRLRSLAPEKYVDSKEDFCSVSIPMLGSCSWGGQVYQATTRRF